MFDGILDIADEVIVVNAKDDQCEGMNTLKEILKNRRDEIAVSELSFVLVFVFSRKRL